MNRDTAAYRINEVVGTQYKRGSLFINLYLKSPSNFAIVSVSQARPQHFLQKECGFYIDIYQHIITIAARGPNQAANECKQCSAPTLCLPTLPPSQLHLPPSILGTAYTLRQGIPDVIPHLCHGRVQRPEICVCGGLTSTELGPLRTVLLPSTPLKVQDA